jgi:hypothetical protein
LLQRLNFPPQKLNLGGRASVVRRGCDAFGMNLPPSERASDQYREQRE